MKAALNLKNHSLKYFYFHFLLELLVILFVGFCNPTACYSAHLITVCNLSADNPFFVGRESYLQQIDSFFKGDRRILALTGASGFGKSQIAKKYAQQCDKNYDFIWWFDSQQDIPSQFERLAVALNTLLSGKDRIIPSAMSKEALVDTVKNILRIKQIKYLLIFDNAEDYEKIAKFIPYAHQSSRKNILLTSRVASIWPDRLEIGKFKREESLQLIKATLSKAKKADMEKLAETLGDYPLELTIAVAFTKSHPTITIDKYLSMHLKRTFKKRERSSNMLLDQYPNNSLASLEISLRYVEEEAEDSLKVLFFMSLINSKDIPETYIELWLKKTNSPLTADEAIKHIYDQSLLGVSETTEFNVNKKLKGQEDMHYLSIHDRIHQLINEEISVEEKRKLLDTATEVLLEIFSGTSEIFIKKIMNEPIHLLHAQKLCENAKEIGYSTPNLLKLRVCIFECLMGPSRNFEIAKNYLEAIEKDLEGGLVLDPYYMALFKINKGFFECTHNVNYDEAIRYMTEGLSILTPYRDHTEEKLRAITNLAQYHTLRGQTDVAEGFINEGKDIFDDSQSIAYKSFFIFAWSLVLTDQGKFKEAEEVLEKANQFPALYPAFEHGILHQKLETFIKQGHLKKASKIFNEYEKKLQEFFKGRQNIGLGNAFFFKGLLLIYKEKNISKALQNLTKALKIYEETFHSDKRHRNQARTHLALGKAHALNKDYTEALKAYLFSEEIYDIVLKEKKIDDVSDLYKELALLGIDMKDDGLTHKYLKAHINIFGHSHPRTQEILHALDGHGLVAPF